MTQEEIYSLPFANGVGIIKHKEASVAFSGGATEVIPVNVPAGVVLLGAKLRNNEVLAGAGAADYDAAYSGGSTEAIGTALAFAKNTKKQTAFDANAATAITSAATNITLTPDAGTLDTGSVTAVVYYMEFDALSDK